VGWKMGSPRRTTFSGSGIEETKMLYYIHSGDVYKFDYDTGVTTKVNGD